MRDPSPRQNQRTCLLVHQQMVLAVLRNLYSNHFLGTQKTRRQGPSLEHLEFDFHDEGDDWRFDHTRHLRSGDGSKTEWEIEALPADFKEIWDKVWYVHSLVCSLDNEVNHWKDRFFFNALDADVDDLCEDCKESMRVAFYVRDGRNQDLEGKPHSGDCCWRSCKYYKKDVFDDFYESSDLREIPCNDMGYDSV